MKEAHYEATIPCIRDRVVQGAVKLILEAIFDADFQSGSYGYRPKKTAAAAIEKVTVAAIKNMTRVIDVDLKSYFDTVRHDIFNFYLLTLLAFFFHQIFELTDSQYQNCREKFGSKKHLWEKLRSWIDIIIFETWEKLLEFALAPKKGLLIWSNTS